MRRFRVITLALLFLALLGTLASSAQAQAPAPKVTIAGFFDVVTSAHWNLSQVDADFTRARDSVWFSRQRTVLVTQAEVENARGVLALEIDLGWGLTGPGTSSTVPAAAPQVAFITGTAFGASTDVLNAIEIKHMFVEFPVPLVPWPTTLRLGGQPGVGTLQYKPVIWIDDFPGVYFNTTFTPAAKVHFLYAQFDEDAFGCGRATQGARDAGACGTRAHSLATLAAAAAPLRTSFQRGDDFVLGLSLDVTPMKGLDVRPFWAHWEQKGIFVNSQNTVLPPPAGTAGGVAGAVFGGDQAKRDWHYFGLDARWRSGPWSLDPTFIWLVGENDLSCGGLPTGAGGCSTNVGAAGTNVTGQGVNAWLVDLRGGYRTGPLLLEGLFAYSPGNDARDNIGVTAGTIHTQNWFQPINSVGIYSAGWSNFFTSNEIDFIRGSAIGTAVNRGAFISYDRYGMLLAAFRPSYALTKALTLKGLVSGYWTAEDVDTHGTFGATGILPETNAVGRGGDDSYLGTEIAASLTWRFAPGLTFDTGVAHLFAGDALDQCKGALVGGVCRPGRRDARDATSIAARVRFAF